MSYTELEFLERDTALFSSDCEAPPMTATWAELFDRGGEYDVTLEDVRTAADDLAAPSATEEASEDV